jgi:UrcA family protein
MFTSGMIALALLSGGGAVDKARFVGDPATGDGVWQVKVARADVTLEDEAGAREMLARLRSAANAICAKQMKAQVSRDWHGCRRETLTHAVQTLKAPRVTAALEAERR